jgi:hypothetical protein
MGFTGGWQQALFDEIEDLFADTRHDLSERLRVLTREVEAVIDQGDPMETWPDIEAWLERRVVGLATANHDLITERAEKLVADLSEQFRLESEVPLDLGFNAPKEVLRGLAIDPADTSAGSRRVARLVLAGRTAVIIPYVVFGVMGSGSLLLLATVGPLSLVLGVGIGRKLLRDERQRQLTYRRQQAKIACRRYLDEANFVIGKDCQDSLRRTRRELRDEFEARAAVRGLTTSPRPRQAPAAERPESDPLQQAVLRAQEAERRAAEAERRADEAERRELERRLREPASRRGFAHVRGREQPSRTLDRLTSWIVLGVPIAHRTRYGEEFRFELDHLASRGVPRRRQWAHVLRLGASIWSLRRELRALPAAAAERA